jgi:outer membrane protein, heavy metal efflux system
MRRALVLCLLAGCSVPREAGFPEVRDMVNERIGQPPDWHRDEVAEQRIRDEVRRVLKEPLTTRSAVRVALINSRALQAELEELGVAQADLVEAGMIENPSIGIDVRFPTTEDISVTKVEGDLGIDFISMFTLAARKRVAEEHFEAVKLRAAAAVLDLCAEVRKAYYELQAAQQLAKVNLTIAQAAQGSFDTATALHRAGNVSDLRLAEEQALYEQARLDMLESDGAVVAAREHLNSLLGLWGADTAWTLAAEFQGVPRDEAPLADLENLAIAERLDLQAAKRQTLVVAEALGLQRDWGWLRSEEIGASLERETDGEVLVGPHAVIELPIFNQGQARVARLEAELRQSYHRVTALAVDIRSDVRRLREELVMHRRRADHYRDVVIPLRERIVALTLEEHDFMLVGIFEVLEKKVREAEAYRDYVQAVRAYWVTRAELERAVGGKLPLVKPGPGAAAPSPPPQPEQKEHSHDEAQPP